MVILSTALVRGGRPEVSGTASNTDPALLAFDGKERTGIEVFNRSTTNNLFVYATSDPQYTAGSPPSMDTTSQAISIVEANSKIPTLFSYGSGMKIWIKADPAGDPVEYVVREVFA